MAGCVLGILLHLCTGFHAGAQTDFTGELKQIQDAYKQSPYLSFRIHYTYADETNPAEILDSSFGKFQISKSRYWGYLDSLEFMQNDSFSLVIYKPGKLIQVNTPTDLYPRMAGFAALDMIVGKAGYTVRLEYSGRQKIIAVTIPEPESPYKSFRLFYDSVSHYVNKMLYTVKEEYVTGDGYADPAGSSGKYIIVQADFSGYSAATFEDTVFATANYFTVNNGKHVPVKVFDGYEVFLSSPKLSSTQQPSH